MDQQKVETIFLALANREAVKIVFDAVFEVFGSAVHVRGVAAVFQQRIRQQSYLSSQIIFLWIELNIKCLKSDNLYVQNSFQQDLIIYEVKSNSIDIREGAILTGANRMNEQLQLWDLGTQKLIENIKWDQKTESAGAYIYGAQFGKSKFPTLGGVAHGTNEIKIFDGTKNGYKAGVSIQRFSKGLYTMDFANTSNKCVFAGGDGVGLMIAIMPFKE